MAGDHDDLQGRDELLASIAEFGVAVRHVFPALGQTRTAFSYTVGLMAVGHPEIVVEGFLRESAHVCFNEVADAVHRGAQGPARGAGPHSSILSSPRSDRLRWTPASDDDLLATGGLRR